MKFQMREKLAKSDEVQRWRAERRASISGACGPEPTAARATARVSKWLEDRHNPHEYSAAAPNSVERKRRFGEVLRQAVREGEYDVVQWLLDACPEAIDQTDDEEVDDPSTNSVDGQMHGGMTALFQALREGYEAIALSLLDRGASVRARTAVEQTCLQAACHSGMGPALIERLIKAAPDLINECDVDGHSAMWYAGESGVTATHRPTLHAASVSQHTAHVWHTPLPPLPGSQHERGGGRLRPTRRLRAVLPADREPHIGRGNRRLAVRPIRSARLELQTFRLERQHFELPATPRPAVRPRLGHSRVRPLQRRPGCPASADPSQGRGAAVGGDHRVIYRRASRARAKAASDGSRGAPQDLLGRPAGAAKAQQFH